MNKKIKIISLRPSVKVIYYFSLCSITSDCFPLVVIYGTCLPGHEMECITIAEYRLYIHITKFFLHQKYFAMAQSVLDCLSFTFSCNKTEKAENPPST